MLVRCLPVNGTKRLAGGVLYTADTLSGDVLYTADTLSGDVVYTADTLSSDVWTLLPHCLAA